jgi:hypothetical protein
MQKKARSISREKLLDELRAVASDLGVTRLAEDEFVARSGLAHSAIFQHFDRWTDACRAAGLERALTIAERPAQQEHTDEDCIREVRRVAQLLGVASLSSESFKRHARISASTVGKRFGGWHAALAAAGLSPTPRAAMNEQLKSDDCVREIQRVAALLHQNHLTMKEFKTHSRLGYSRILRNMSTWHNALAAAGLTPSPEFKAEVPLEKLANDFLQASIEIGQIPTLVQVTRRSDHAEGTFARKHGGYSAFKRHAIQHLLSSDARIPPAIKDAFRRELERPSNDDVTTPVDATKVTTKVEIGQNGIVPSIAALLKDWHPSSLRNELAYSKALANHLRTVLPDDAQVDREYRHEGTTCDIRIAYNVDDEVFLEMKWQLQKKAECDRLIGQVEGLKPKKNKIIVVLVGDTNLSLLGRLKAHFNSYLADQRVGEEKFMVVCVS